MNDFDDLDDVFGPLRSAATDAELAGERSHVDAMARQHRRQKGHIMFSSRRARVATFVAAGVMGFGGIAAAGQGGPLSRSGGGGTTTTTTTTEVTTTTSEAPTTTSEVTTTTSEVQLDDAALITQDALITQSLIEELPAADSPELVDDPDTEFDETRCLEGNHGKTVSAVARGEEGFEDVEQRVVAQSSCGKDAKDVEDEIDDDDADERDEVEARDDDSDDDSDEIDDDDEKDERSEKSERSGKPESAGKQGKGSNKHSDDD